MIEVKTWYPISIIQTARHNAYPILVNIFPKIWKIINVDKARFFLQYSDQLSNSKNLTSLFPLIFLSKHINLYALGWLKWILDIVWPLNQHFNLKNQRNWRTTFFMLRFLIGTICILLHRPKKLTLALLIFKVHYSSLGCNNDKWYLHVHVPIEPS